VELIFPNVEMRLDLKTARSKGINLHLLFSPDDPEHEQHIERILGRLMFDFQERKYSCTRTELIALGRKFNPRQTDDEGAFCEGIGQFKVTLPELRQLFKDDVWLRNNCLVAVASSSGDGTAGLQEDGAFVAVRQEIERFAHIIFSGKKADRDFWLGLKPGMDRAAIERTYRAIKPCMHGCDAHHLDRVGAPELSRYCWIKGDLAFESLRQAVIEPEERVSISERSPTENVDSVTIANVRPIGMPWLLNEVIELNRGLVSIIGERGSGKTALVDLIAAGAQAIGNNLGESSFLKRATSPIDLIGNAEVEEVWADGAKKRAPFRPPDEWADEWPQVRYLSQQFVDQLCSSAGLAVELRQEIERVIFDQTDPTDRFETDSFEALAALLLEPIRRRRQQQIESMTTNSTKIADESRLRDQLPKFRADRKDLDQQLTKSRRDLNNLLPKEKAKRAKRLIELDQACTNAENRIESLRRRQKALDDLFAETEFIRDQDAEQRLAEMRERFAESGLTDADWQNFRLKFTGNIAAIIAEAKRAVLKEITTVQSGDPHYPVDVRKTPVTDWPLTALKSTRDTVKKDVGIDEVQQKKYDALKKTIITNESTLRKWDLAIKSGEGADERLRLLREARRQAYRSVFETFAEEESVLARLYGPLHHQLEGAQGALAKLRFVVRRHVRLDDWVKDGEVLLDLRKETRFRGHGALAKIAKDALLSPWRDGTPDEVAKAMHDFVAMYYSDLEAAIPSSVEPGSGRAEWFRQVGVWLYNTEHIEIRYGIEYDGVAVETLSPGTRGIVLLLLYLAIDLSDRRPLLIDQPEENLDPKSVFEDLVPHFRQARQRRQVIIVTHNANLVVNTDADQVILATSNPGNTGGLPHIKYQGGSLENPTIRRAVCDILEGGERAFLERERRYRLQWQHILGEAEQPEAANPSLQKTQAPVTP
jgi:ABC-type lipoprotein export system ATPase subunit